MTGAVRRMMVVEDDPGMSQAIERILRAGGLSPDVFASAEAALEEGAALSADCMVLDIHLPGMSGFDLYRRLRSDGDERPVVFITAHDEPSVREEAKSIGAGSYLPKPFSGRALLELVTDAITAD